MLFYQGGRAGSNYDRDYPQQSRGRDDRRSGGGGSSYRGGASQMTSGGLLGASPNETVSNPPAGYSFFLLLILPKYVIPLCTKTREILFFLLGFSFK